MNIETVNTKTQHNIALGFELGFKMPEVVYIDPSQVQDYTGWYIDTATWLAMEKIDGIDISYSVWYDEGKYSFHTIIINDKHLLSGRQGICLNTNCVTVFPCKLDIMKPILSATKKKLKEDRIDYTGFIVFDVTLSHNKAWYRKIHFNTQWDYVHAMAALVDLNAEQLISNMETGTEMEKPEGFACSTRLYAYPYDIEFNKSLEFPEGLQVYESDSSYVLTARGRSVKQAWKALYGQTKGMPEGICYRIDGKDVASWTVNSLLREKYYERNHGKPIG